MFEKLLPLLLALFISFNVVGQVNKFRTKQIAIKMLQDDGNWDECSDWEKSNSLITFNGDIDRITIHGEPNRTFDVISSEEITGEDGEKILVMNCIGANENECVFKIVYDKDYNIQFYIFYSKAAIVYNVISLD